MSRLLLDTNILSELMRHPYGKAARRLAELPAGQACTSIIVTSELFFGAERRKSRKLAEHIANVLAAIEIVPFSKPADEFYARVRTQLEASGTPIGANDMLIAAHALALDCILVTGNEREFTRVQGLKIENWLR